MNQEPETDRRVTIWSVPEDWQKWYLALFNLQILCLLGLVSWHEVATAAATDGPIDVLIAVGSSMAGLVVVVAAESIFLTDVTKMLFTMISEKYLNRREERGRTEGRTEGRVEGRTEERRKWEEWNERRLAAEAAGEEFTEPAPPPSNSNGSG